MNKHPALCYLCGNDNTDDFLELPPTPTQDGVMAATLEQALDFPKGQINLRFCKQCGYIGNETYDADKVRFDDYDFSNDHSALFSDYVQHLSQRLVDTYQVKGKTILDVGCGDGYFLEHICALGGNKGIGIDSGFDHSQRKTGDGLDVTYIQDYYTEKYNSLLVDLVAIRLVIDLLPDPVGFIQTCRRNLEGQSDAVIYVEVPSANYTFNEQIIWNVVYEHRSWFTAESLRYLFERCGFEVLDVVSVWNDEYLGIEAKISSSDQINSAGPSADLSQLEQMVSRFADSYQSQLTKSETRIAELRQSNARVVGWGAGARSVAFLNMFDLVDLIPCIVDVNVNRQGKFVPGSGQKIVPPAFLKEYLPDVVVITNSTYAAEIQQSIDDMGLKPEIWVL